MGRTMPLAFDPTDPQACQERVIEALKIADISEVARVLNCTLLSSCPRRDQCRHNVEVALMRFPADPLQPEEPENTTPALQPGDGRHGSAGLSANSLAAPTASLI